MTSAADPRIGTIVMEKLRVDARLGAGGMGAVYRVHHLVTKHDRALKVLHADLAGDAEVIKRLTREAGVAGTLRSPHVVETLDVGELEDGSPFVLMELLDGEPLADRMERGAIASEELIGFVCQACQGVVHAHAAGIVHRDLKPENLFIVREPSGEERIKILDFGISKFQVETFEDGAVTREGTVLGTPLYMSPEQSTGQADLGPATDIYSLGVILYEGLSGSTPHEAHNFPQLIVQLNTEPAKPLRELVPEIDPELAAIVDRSLSIRPADRPPSAEALLRALAPFADPRRVAHLDALRDAPPVASKPAIISMAATMAGGLIDGVRAPSEPPRKREPAPAPSSKPPPSNRTQAIEPKGAVQSTEDEREEDEDVARVPRPSWMPWAIGAAALALAVGLGIAFAGSGDEGDGDSQDAPVPAASAPEPEPAPEPVERAQAPEPAAPEPTAPDSEAEEPAEPPVRVAPAAAEPPAPRVRAPSAPRAPAPLRRHDVARDNPYE